MLHTAAREQHQAAGAEGLARRPLTLIQQPGSIELDDDVRRVGPYMEVRQLSAWYGLRKAIEDVTLRFGRGG
jgi:hypothetical protein